MATCPSTPPRRTRVETPEAPLHGINFDKGKKKERKEKELEKAQQKEEKERQKEISRVCPPSSRKAKTSASVSFGPSPPGSPVSTGLPSPTQEKFNIFKDGKEKSTITADPFAGPSHSTTKYKKFKPPPAAQNIRNPFAPQEASQEPTGAESLPTPTKTPSRKRKFMLPSEEEEELDSASRILFPDRTVQKPKTPISSAAAATLAEILGEPLDEAPSAKPSTRKKANNKLDVARDLFGSSEVVGSRKSGASESIEIYTDSNARVPEYDPSPENPFVDHPEGSTRRSSEKAAEKERKRREKIEKNREEFEALRAGREDGMVYTLYGCNS